MRHVASMHTRCLAVIQADGGHTRPWYCWVFEPTTSFDECLAVLMMIDHDLVQNSDIKCNFWKWGVSCLNDWGAKMQWLIFIILMLKPVKYIALAILKFSCRYIDYFLNYSKKSIGDVIRVYNCKHTIHAIFLHSFTKKKRQKQQQKKKKKKHALV